MAVNDPTANFKWNIPNDLADDGAWGAILRQIYGEDTGAGAAPNGSIDTILQEVREASTIDTSGDTWNVVDNTATRAVKASGDSMTGELDILTERFTAVDLGNMTGTVTMDLDAGNVFFGTKTGTDVTFAFDNVPASPDAVFVTVKIVNGGFENVIVWPGTVVWPGGSPPAFTESGTDVVTLFTHDGGLTWYAAVAMLDLS